MKQKFLIGTGSLLMTFAAGLALASTSFAATRATPTARDVANDPYIVSIDEIAHTFVTDHPFTGGYTTTVTMSNGLKRRIKLTPLIKDGMLVVQFDDSGAGGGSGTFMGPNGTTTNGAAAKGMLMVRLRDLDQPPSAWEWGSSHCKAPAPVLANGVMLDPAKTRFVVSVYEIKKNLAFGQPFSDHYTKRVTMADGSQRTIDLTAGRKDGKAAIKLNDSGRVSVVLHAV